jgi:hypothetical protein
MNNELKNPTIHQSIQSYQKKNSQEEKKIFARISNEKKFNK